MSDVDRSGVAQTILETAGELFAEKGFNGTSVKMIAEKAGVNKALIYYYFKDKNDIVKSLFDSVIQESNKRFGLHGEMGSYENLRDKIKEELDFLFEKPKMQKILSVMLMESLKGDDQNNYIFQCAESVIRHTANLSVEDRKEESNYSEEMLRYFVDEFFTGFVPIVTFIVFGDKWCDYFKCTPGQLKEYFLDSFQKSHLACKAVINSDQG